MCKLKLNEQTEKKGNQIILSLNHTVFHILLVGETYKYMIYLSKSKS